MVIVNEKTNPNFMNVSHSSSNSSQLQRERLNGVRVVESIAEGSEIRGIEVAPRMTLIDGRMTLEAPRLIPMPTQTQATRIVIQEKPGQDSKIII